MLSRTEAATAIAAGRVAVDGDVCTDPERRVDPDHQRLLLDGAAVRRVRRVWLAMHKPVGVVTTRRDERGRPTVYDLLPDGLPLVAPVGRLDLDSSGLLLFTNDTRLADAVIAPDGHLPKVYEVDCDGDLLPAHVAAMTAGMTLPDGTRLLPTAVTFADAGDRRRARFTLREGKNRQIRRMVEACGRGVVRLHRVAIGPLRLGRLQPGAVRPLDDGEVDGLRRAARAPQPDRQRRARRRP